MKEWFKARNIWGAAITALSDEEAGRLAKALWAYTMNGEITQIEGAGKGIFAMIVMTLDQDAERDTEISEKRSVAGKSKHLISIDNKCKQMISNADNKNKNKNKEQEQESESLLSDDEANRTQSEQDRVLDAAEDAGFRITNDVTAALIALYAEYGLVKLLDGIKACSEHGAANLAYLRAVLAGKPRKPKVSAQDYDQRDYTDVQNAIDERIRKRMQEVG